MLTKIFKYMSSLTINLKFFHNILFRPNVDELLYLAIALLNSSVEKGAHSNTNLNKISFKILVLT